MRSSYTPPISVRVPVLDQRSTLRRASHQFPRGRWWGVLTRDFLVLSEYALQAAIWKERPGPLGNGLCQDYAATPPLLELAHALMPDPTSLIALLRCFRVPLEASASLLFCCFGYGFSFLPFAAFLFAWFYSCDAAS